MNKVIVKECSVYNVNEIINRINSGVELVGGWESFVKPGMKVLLKVNLIGPKQADSAAITHPEFVRALVRILKNKGCLVWIGDSAGGAIAGIAPTKKSFAISGLEKMALEEDVEIKNFDAEGIVSVKPVSNITEKMYLAKPLFEADLIINLPKLKTHSAAIYTGAVKNVFGCIPGLMKAHFHKLAPDPIDFGHIIADIHNALKIDLHIMDGILAMQGEGPTAGDKYQANKIIISKDPLALDIIAIEMLGLKLQNVPILMTAKDRKLGEFRLENIKIEGDYSILPKLNGFKFPKRLKSTRKQNYKVLVKVIDFLKARPKIDTKLCINCNMCVESCPVGAIDKNLKIINYSLCIECMCCHELCMHQAVKLKKVNPIAGIMTKMYRGNYR